MNTAPSKAPGPFTSTIGLTTGIMGFHRSDSSSQLSTHSQSSTLFSGGESIGNGNNGNGSIGMGSDIATSSGSNFFGSSLLSFEQLENRSSPDLWPEQLPGVSEFTAAETLRGSPTSEDQSPKSNIKCVIDNEDLSLMNELSLLNADKLMEHIKALQNLAYQYGIEEAKQLTRGKILKILEKSEPQLHWD